MVAATSASATCAAASWSKPSIPCCGKWKVRTADCLSAAANRCRPLHNFLHRPPEKLPALHDMRDAAAVLQNRDILERSAIRDDQIGNLAGLEGADIGPRAHGLGAELCGGDQGVHRRVAGQLHVVRQLPRVSAMRTPGEAEVAADQDADATAPHFVDVLDGGVQLFLVMSLLEEVAVGAKPAEAALLG